MVARLLVHMDGVNDDTVLLVRNTHVPECGMPPRLAHPTNDKYVASFTGTYGDQWTLEINVKAQTGVLRGGDIGWHTEIRLEDNRIGGGVILGEEEFAWLGACWLAATGRKLQPPANLFAMRMLRELTEGDGEQSGG